jgi:hypothetical protein
VPLAYGEWSSMSDWYETPEFRGHVREPDVEDLRYIAHDIGIVDCRFHSQLDRVRESKAVGPAGYVRLRLFPTLWGEIYLVGKKTQRRR